MDLKPLIAKALNLDERPRRFLVSVSGGADSSVLLECLSQLSANYPIQLHVFHMNFNLRGRESKRDEVFVRALAKRLKLGLTVKSVRVKGRSAIQEQARKLRLSGARLVKPDYELIEAHHLDDQIETFFLKLFRGAGPHGLVGIKTKSKRDGRTLWRPLLEVSKLELKTFAKAQKIKFVDDSSNLTDQYDRNWIRLKLLPRIHKRFPSAKNSIARFMKILGQQSQAKILHFDVAKEKIVTSAEPLVWAWSDVQKLSQAGTQEFIHIFFRTHLGIELSHRHIVDLTKAIALGDSFSINAPKKIVIRGRRQSQTVKFPQIRFYRASATGLDPLGVTISDSTLY